MSRPTVAVVIPHWYEERGSALSVAVDALRAGTVAPDEIIIWDNTDSLFGRGVLQADVRLIRASVNVGPKARFLAALTASTDYVFFQDNDMVVELATLANLLAWAEELGGIVTLEGRRVFSHTPYRHWPKIHGHGLTLSCRVPISLGRAELVARTALPALLAWFPWEPGTVFDDLWFSAAAGEAGTPIRVVPSVKGTSDLRDLRTGVGLCTEPGYYDRRDALAQYLFCGGPPCPIP